MAAYSCRYSFARMPRAQPTPLERAGVPIECLDLSEFRWRVFAQLLRVLRRHKIDIIHWNFTPPLRNSYLWWLTLLRPGITHYYTDHISRTTAIARLLA